MNKKRNWVYFILALIGLILVIGKQQAVIWERDQVIISTVSEWKEKGKPIVVYEVKNRDIPLYAKVTAWQASEHTFEGFVSKEVRNKIRIGQNIAFYVDNQEFKGIVSTIADELSLGAGMYRVQATLDQSFDLKGWVVAFAHIDTLKGVICIPNEVISKEDELSFIWKAQGDKAIRQQVIIGQRDGYGAVVTQGLDQGDMVIVKGFFMLSEGDKVNILSKISAEEMEND